MYMRGREKLKAKELKNGTSDFGIKSNLEREDRESDFDDSTIFTASLTKGSRS